MEDKRLRFQQGKQREFLEEVIKERFGTQTALGRFLGVHKHTVKGWVHEEKNMSKSTFQKIVTKYPFYKHFGSSIEEELPWNWGQKKGGKQRVESIDNLSAYLRYVRSFISNNSEARRAKKVEIENPLLDQLIKEDVDLMSILAVCIQTDGSLVEHSNSYRIASSSSDSVLINFVQALLSNLSRFNPAISMEYKGVRNVTLTDKDLGKKLLMLSPEYRTYPIDENFQPTINFLNDKNIQTKIWATRFAFTTDGCISLSKQGKPELNFACYNKILSEEWQKFLTQFGINGHVAKCKKSRQGVSGVRIYDFRSIYNFYKLGGFIDGVKISKKSTRYTGIEKNQLLKKVINLGVQKKVLKKYGAGRIRTPDLSVSAGKIISAECLGPLGHCPVH